MLVSFATLGACSSGLTSVVRDGGTGEAIGGARVTLAWSGWGWRDGRLVWDAEKYETALSASDGIFRFAKDGGTTLIVDAPGFSRIETGVCTQGAPVFVGGPFHRTKLDGLLAFPTAATPGPPPLAADFGGRELGSALGLEMHVPPEDGSNDAFTLTAMNDREIAFLPGTGNIPAPPSRGWARKLPFRRDAACGWVFLAYQGEITAIVATGPAMHAETVGGNAARLFPYSRIYR